MRIPSLLFKVNFITAVFLSCLISMPLLAKDKPSTWQDIDRIGLYKSDKQGQIDSDIWKNYSQAEALNVLNQFPRNLSSPAYRSIAQKILLSQAKSKNEDIKSPALLLKRLSLLIQYGLLDDAKALFSALPKDIDETSQQDLALMQLQLNLIDGKLAPACLDIQAIGSGFSDSDAWGDLANFCRARFGNGESLSFKAYPELKPLLNEDQTIDVATADNLVTLLAYADDKILTEPSYSDGVKSMDKLSDFLVSLAIQPRFQSMKTYQCYAMEAAKRGIVSKDGLQKLYESKSFPPAQLNSNDAKVALRICDVPAFFYQRLANVNPENEKDKAETVKAMMKATQSMSIYALSPFASDIAKYASEDSYWRGAMILGAEDEAIPERFAPMAMPLIDLQNKNQLSESDYKKWLSVAPHREKLDLYKIDYLTPLYYSLILSGDFNNLKDNFNKIKYDNLFSLTYEKKSLHLGLGFNAYIADAYRNKDSVRVLAQILNIMGAKDARSYSEDDIAVILSTYKAYKLEKEVVKLVFEYLQ